MVVVSVLPHVEVGPNDHRERIPLYMMMIFFSVVFANVQKIAKNESRINSETIKGSNYKSYVK